VFYGTKTYFLWNKNLSLITGKLKDLGNSILGKFGLSLDNFNFAKDPATGSYSVNMKNK
jgi:hypothetical protein